MDPLFNPPPPSASITPTISTSPPPAPAEKNNSCSEEGTWQTSWQRAIELLEITTTNITVANPELIKGSVMSSSYVVFLVQTQPFGYKVKRRYSDFVWLRDTLIHRYQGLFIPALPSTTTFTITKTVISGSSTNVNGNKVRNRMVQLDLFAKKLCQLGFVLSDPSYQSFISIQDPREFKAFQDASNKADPAAISSAGVLAWRQLIDVPRDLTVFERKLADFTRQIELLRSSIGQLESQCMSVGRSAMNYSLEVNAMAKSLRDWNTVEADLANPASSECPNIYGDKVKKCLEALSEGGDAWLQYAEIIPKMVAMILCANIQFQQAQVEGMRDMLHQRAAYIKDLEKAIKEKAKAEEDLKQPSKSAMSMFSRQGTAEKEERVARKSQAVEDLNLTISRISNALLFCEMDRFNNERMNSIRLLVGSLIIANDQIHRRTAQKWAEISQKHSISGAEYETIAAAVGTSDDEVIFSES